MVFASGSFTEDRFTGAACLQYAYMAEGHESLTVLEPSPRLAAGDF